MRTPPERRRPPGKKGQSCFPPRPTTDKTRRVQFTDTSVSIFAWPSRGGVIILKDATHVDFMFLGLSTIDPPLKRRLRSSAASGGDHNHLCSGDGSADIDPGKEANEGDEEDALCQRLLMLGAKWWDSEKRYQFVRGFGADIEPLVEDVEEGRVEEPTLRERRWVKVGWEPAAGAPSNHSKIDASGSGGLWVLDCDTNWMGILEEDNLVPADAARVKLASSMEERCEILKRMGAKFYVSLEQYEGDTTFLRAWEWKWEGEIGHLRKVDS
ncbi:MAG: hypothetical protein L6R39_003877 [Caloplaca ligustica]|nr:MAG: hypothetical protein L6R39_003877 [Caloplaca ligustica]